MSYIRKVKMEVGEVIVLTCLCHILVDQGVLTKQMVNDMTKYTPMLGISSRTLFGYFN